MLNFTEWLVESKQVGIVYHFTKLDYYKIMSDKLMQHQNLSSDVFTMFSPKGLSLTRNFKLSSEPYGHFNTHIIRLVIDGTKLSTRYKIKPVLGFKTNDYTPNDVLDIKQTKRVPVNYNEQEEFVIPKNEKVNLLPYLKEINFYENTDYFKNEINKLHKLGIGASIETKLKSYNK